MAMLDTDLISKMLFTITRPFSSDCCSYFSVGVLLNFRLGIVPKHRMRYAKKTTPAGFEPALPEGMAYTVLFGE